MDAVVKVGGSLLAEPEALKALCRTLDAASRQWRIAVVAGGGSFADEVRLQDRRFGLSPQTAHQMAILAMDQYGLLLAELLENGASVRSLRGAVALARKGKLPVILPSSFLLKPNPLDATWDVTSDTIAAYLAARLRAQRLILVTDVDGLFTADPKRNPRARLIPTVSLLELSQLPERTCVDRALPSQLRRQRVDTWIVSGLHPERLLQLLRGVPTVSTRLFP